MQNRSAPVTESHRRGRQGEAARNDARVLQAAREVFASGGWSAPVALVAQLAGVGMGTLYRRYGSKEDLLRHLCLVSLRQMTDAVETALAESTPTEWATFETFVRTCVAHRAGAFGAIAGHLPPDAQLSDAAEQVHAKVDKLVCQTQQAGGLRADVTAVDIYQLLEMMSRGPLGSVDGQTETLMYKGQWASDRRLAILLSGLRSEAAVIPLPQPERWADYKAKWERARSENR